MMTHDEVKKLFEDNQYILRTADLRAAKIYYADIQKLLDDGVIEKVRRGYYVWRETDEISDAALIRRLYPDAVMCLDTALFHYGYSDRVPAEWHLSVDKNVAKYRVKIDYPFVKLYFLEPHILALGVCESGMDGVKIKLYDKDRTICDCLRYMNKMDKEVFNKAVQSYVQDSEKNIPNLMKYAKEMRVQGKVKSLIGVWL